MGFREEWQARRAREAEELQQAVNQAREQWLGRRVWVWANTIDRYGPIGRPEWQAGEVTSVEDRGWIEVLYGYTDFDQPVYHPVEVTDLGRLVLLAE